MKYIKRGYFYAALRPQLKDVRSCQILHTAAGDREPPVFLEPDASAELH